ncbi:MAG: carcinine hydrolase/isopenicillin-N N-acyltransferase family protein [Bacteroidota bacterium]|nr:carcinine hydrolase/isopenicillin-N N-acyltransferase family protein [Bacteroidota bacterium]
MNKLIIFLVALFFAAGITDGIACTTAIVSGKATPDGRPLLFKQRDTDELHNKIEFFKDGKFDYVGLVNSNDPSQAVWGGYNSAGFAIINSASYNLNSKDPANAKDREGEVMRMALQRCATVSDFEHLLDSLPKPLGVEANFGVIDAKGGGAYFETGNSRYVKYDVNDPAIAPKGYIIRTNFSFSGDRSQDKGVSRYLEAEQLFTKASTTQSLSCDFFLHTVARCLTHGLTKTNLYDAMPSNGDTPVFVPFRDFIPRYITSATVLIQGTKEQESSALTTMWTILGSPLTSVAIPVWMNPKGYFPLILLPNETGNAPLCEWSLQLKKQLFPVTKGEGSDYLNLSALINKENKGILQKNSAVEKEIISRSETNLNGWRSRGINYQEMDELYRWINQFVSEYFSQTPGYL